VHIAPEFPGIIRRRLPRLDVPPEQLASVDVYGPLDAGTRPLTTQPHLQSDVEATLAASFSIIDRLPVPLPASPRGTGQFTYKKSGETLQRGPPPSRYVGHD
jgi:hypothetical protein